MGIAKGQRLLTSLPFDADFVRWAAFAPHDALVILRPAFKGGHDRDIPPALVWEFADFLLGALVPCAVSTPSKHRLKNADIFGCFARTPIVWDMTAAVLPFEASCLTIAMMAAVESSSVLTAVVKQPGEERA
jgi:hypothetical protein